MQKRILSYDLGDPICALATPWGTSAIAVIRTSGEGSIELVSKIFSRPEALKNSKGGRLHHGFLISKDTGKPIDEVMIAIFRCPHSYTGEDSAEIYCHGSLPGIRSILETLRNMGFRPAEPGEFTYRAFMHGKMDLTRAEAVHEIVTAKTQKAHLLALHRLGGALEKTLQGIRSVLLDLQTSIEIQLDYPEEDAPTIPIPKDSIQNCIVSLDRLLQTYQEGKLYQEGVQIALAGRTNVGKSSLFNRFLREERSIVSEIHGTTRDYIEATVSIGGIPVRLYDTAGIRTSLDPIEAEGVKRSLSLIDSCALVLFLIDCTDPYLTDEEERFIARQGNRVLRVYTKIDLRKDWYSQLNTQAQIGVSALTGEGFDRLLKEIETRLKEGLQGGTEEVLIESDRQKELIERCRNALIGFQEGIEKRLPLDVVAMDIQDSLQAIGELTGEITTEEMLTRMFSRFCVGK
ncbi:MAG: tRNA uridine-5-carboxymethylaminomethyl(34) synthesis GTPase MnmE [Spirochaetes bacterium]|nr:tRNA uridine-5-carboxymethylaminomethyl(34) synthesis GTPase MnmE [Spirochaetota bacterium]